MRSIYLLSGLLVYLFLSACGTTQVQMDHGTYTGERANNPIIAVGTFTDQRKHEPYWLGAIRGGFGNPLKTLETPKPVKDVVRDTFEEALKQRGLYSEMDDATYVLNVDVIQYDCNQYVRKEAHIRLAVRLVERATNKEVFSDHVIVDKVEGSALSLKAGIFASIEELEILAEKTLAQAVNDVFDAPSLQSLYQQST